MIRIKEAVIVEGKYDKMRLQEVCDALIITTDGFRIFKDNEKKEFLKALAERQGLLVLTDSDRAGFAIRAHLKSFIKDEYIKNAYIPKIDGKERRKKSPSKEGLLGVEGIDGETLAEVLRRAEATQIKSPENPITKADLYELSLFGRPESATTRRALQEELKLPPRLGASAFLKVLNSMFTREEFYEFVGQTPTA